MLKKILIGLAVIIAGFLAFVATRPDTQHIERKQTIKAPAEVIFPHINSLEKITAWSPWAKLDPNQKITYEGPKEGVGNKMSWVGNDQVGQGEQAIIDSQPNKSVTETLHFIKPFESTAKVTFSLKENAADRNTTNITWAMDSDMTFPSKLFGVFMDMDAMIGKDFESGLDSLKALIEKDIAVQAEDRAAKAAAIAAAATAAAAATCTPQCDAESHCENVQVQCATTPCPPVPTCVKNAPAAPGTAPPSPTKTP